MDLGDAYAHPGRVAARPDRHLDRGDRRRCEGRIAHRLADDPGYQAIQAIHGVGPVLAAVFVAEIGDVDPFPDRPPPVRLGRADPPAPRVRHQGPPGPHHQDGMWAAEVDWAPQHFIWRWR